MDTQATSIPETDYLSFTLKCLYLNHVTDTALAIEWVDKRFYQIEEAYSCKQLLGTKRIS